MKTTKMFKSALQSLNLFVMIFSFAACTDKQLEFSGTGSSISGSIAGFSALSSKPSQSISAFSCTTPQAEIYSLDSNGVRSSSALATTAVAANGTFTFKNITSLGIDTQSSKVKYLIAISGCSDPLSRPLTDKKNQEISWGSTIVEKVSLVEYTGKKTLSEAQKAEVISLITKLDQISGSSLDAIFTNILSNPTVSSGFQTIFQLPATELQYSQPTVNTTTAPSSVNELSTAAFSVSASHWHPSYTVAYIWKLDGSQVATTANYNYTPSKTSQGTHTLELFIGMSDGAGGIDLTKAYVTRSFTLTVNDTYYPVPPALTLATSSPTNSQNVTISMNTGASFVNCDSFSTLALTEDSPTAPILASAYNMTCISAGSQNINYTLTSSEGIHTLRLWARDSDGNRSPTPSAINVILDTTSPVVSITAQPNVESNSTSANFSFSAIDANAIDHYECKLDAGSYATCTSPLSYSSLAAGSHTFSVKAIDAAGNTSSVVSHTWNIDLVAPTIAITTPSADGTFAASASLSSFTVSGTCSENTRSVQISGSISGSTTCSGGAWSTSLNLSSLTDGTLSITATHADAASNSTTTTARTFIKDTVLPAIAVATPSATKGNASVGNASWTLTEANIAASTTFTVEVYTGSSWVSVGTPAATAGSNSSQGYSLTNYSVPSADTTVAKVRVSVTDAAGNTTQSQSGNFIIDSTAPSAISFTINGGTGTTVSYNIPVAFQAQDAQSVQEYCIKYNETTQPASNDSCWVQLSTVGVTPASNVTVSSASFRVGLIAGNYLLALWLKDTLGNISTLTQTVGTDYGTVNYTPGNPPSVGLVTATNTDAPSAPPTQAELTATSGSSVYIKWTITNTGSLGATPVEIFYTTDDTNWTAIGAAVANAQGAGCTISGTETGCFKWVNGSPTNNFFRVRVKATDTQGFSSQSSSLPLNVSAIRFISGNTEAGINGSAGTAIFLNTIQSDPRAGDRSTLIVHPNGTIYFIDALNGVLKISPDDGILRKFIAKSTTSTGDGGPVASATVREPAAMVLDSQNNLVIMDYNRLRKVNLSANPPTISAFIGGGANAANTSMSPLDLSMDTITKNNKHYSNLHALPNGDLIFRSSNYASGNTAGSSNRIRWYKASTGLIETVLLTGAAVPSFPGIEVGNCNMRSWVPVVDSSGQIEKFLVSYLVLPVAASALCNQGNTFHSYYTAFFDTTGQFLSNGPTNPSDDGLQFYLAKNNEIYFYTKAQGTFKKYNKTTNLYVNVNMSGRGYCPDGTLFTACKTEIHDTFIDSNGKIYFVDNGRIRTVADDGTVFTMAGSGFGYGDGMNPLLARYGEIQALNSWNNGSEDKVVTFDSQVHAFKEFGLNPGSVITHLAGNGTIGVPNTTNTAVTLPIYDITGNIPTRSFGLDELGNIYFGGSNTLMKLNRSDNKWINLVGGGATNYASADGLVGTSVALATTYSRGVFGYGNGKILSANSMFTNPNTINPYLNTYSTTDGTQSTLAGITGSFAASNVWCADGTVLTNCQVPGSNYTPSGTYYDSTTSSWLLAFSSNIIKKLTPGGNMVTYYSGGGTVRGFALNKSGGNEYLYFCDRSVSPGKIKKVDIINSTSAYLTWPMSSISCDGYQGVHYNASRNSLIFVYSQNGLFGVAEYLNP